MARSLNFKCDSENGFFSCNLPKDTVLLEVKVKTKTGNHMLVEDTEKWTEKFGPWKKPTKYTFCFILHEDGCHIFTGRFYCQIIPNLRAYLYIYTLFMDNLHNNYSA